MAVGRRMFDTLTGAPLPVPGPGWLASGQSVRPTATAIGSGKLIASAAELKETLLSWPIGDASTKWTSHAVGPFDRFVADPRGEHALLSSDSSLARVDLTTMAVAVRVASPLAGPQSWSYTAGGKYVLGASDDALVFLDPRSLAVVERLPLSGRRPPEAKAPAVPLVPPMQLGRHALAIARGRLLHIDTTNFAIAGDIPASDAKIYRQDGNVAFGVKDYVSDDVTFDARDAWTGAPLSIFGGAIVSTAEVLFDAQGRLLWASAGGLNGTDLADGQLTRVIDVGTARELAADRLVFGGLSSDARWLAGWIRGQLYILQSLETGARQHVDFSKLSNNAGSCSGSYHLGEWSRDGRYFACEVRELVGERGSLATAGAIGIWDTKEARPVSYLRSPDGIGDWIGLFSPDGSIFVHSIRPANVYGDQNRSFEVLEVRTGKVLLQGSGLPGAVSLDGKSLLLRHASRLSTSPIDLHGGGKLPDLPRQGYESHPEWSALVRAYDVGRQSSVVNGDPPVDRSADGSRIACGDHAGNITLADGSTGKVLQTFKGHEGKVTKVQLSPDGSRMLTYGADSLTHLWNTATAERLVSFAITGWVLHRPRELIAFTPEGYYFGQRAAVQKLGFSNGLRGYPAAQFDAWLNRPDIVLERVGTAALAAIEYYRRAHERRVRKLGLSSDAAPEYELPELTLHRERLAASVTKRRLKLEVDTIEHGAPITGLQVYANGVALFGGRGAPIQDGGVEVDLVAGSNRLEVSAVDALGRESVPEVAIVQRVAPATKPDLYVLAVGVSKYRQSEHDLQYAAKDAQDLTRELATSGPRTYREVHTRTILDGEATRENILAAREHLLRAGIDDVVLVFFAGHGLLDDRAGYFFATPDLDFANPGDRGLSFDQMESLLAGIPSRHRLMLVDTCAAGETDEDEVARTRESTKLAAGVMVASRGVKVRSAGAQPAAARLLMTRELFGSLGRGSGASVIGSSSGVEYAFESAELRNGIFTASLLEVLRETHTQPWAITVDGLQSTIRRKVEEKSGGLQHPVARETNPYDPFVVWQVGTAKGKPGATKRGKKR